MARKEPFLIFTDDQCVIRNVIYPGIPLLVNSNNHILEAPSDWFRYLIVMRRSAKDSVRQFAYHLKYWWTYLNRNKIEWNSVDDFVMMNWRDEYLEAGSSEGTVNGYLSTVFRMYLWAEKNAYTHELIGEADWERGVRPPLSVEIRFDRRGIKRYSSPLLIKTTAKPILPTPTNDEITKVHEALAELYGNNINLMVRDALILSWMEQTGIRREETLTLRQSQIPEWKEIMELEEAGEKKEITVIGKGNKRRSLWVGADLLSQTRDYIEEERQVIVTRFHNTLRSHYKNPPEIFLSSKTGLRMNRDSISQKFAKAFRKAGVRGSGHRVRARFLTNLAVNTFERELEKLGAIPDMTSALLPVAQIAGHSNIETLSHYLALSKKRLLQQTTAERAASAEERAIVAERSFHMKLIKLKGIDSVHALVKAIQSGSKKIVTAELQRLLAIYNQ